MDEHLLTSLAVVIVLGIAAQWLAWRVKLASILLLLFLGIVAGGLGLLDTDALMGALLFPVVSLSVAVILFEGGLSLRLGDLRDIGSVVRRMISFGALVTWITSAVAAILIFGLDVEIGLLLGAILVVTGPTVVIPLLNQVRPAGRVSSILRWEGIMIDPIGAILAVLIFEEILAGVQQPGIVPGLIALVQTLLIGGIIGGLGAYFLIQLFSRYWVPDNLQNPITLMGIVGLYTLSNQFQAEAGLMTVTMMGITMANQNRFDVRHLIEFEENIQILLLSSLFILLAARVELDSLIQLGPGIILFIAVLMLVVRSLAVWVSTRNSILTRREKLFIAWLAPRGIVAASVASIFALELAQHGHAEAEILTPITFSVIIGTVTIYSLTAGLLAKRLGLAQDNPQGVLIVGAHGWARKIAGELQAAGVRTVVADTNPGNIFSARNEGLTYSYGSVLSDPVVGDMDLSGIGRVLALTRNDEVNSLAAMRFADRFGSQEVYQLPRRNGTDNRESVTTSLRGRDLFREDVTFDYLNLRFTTGAEMRAIRVKDPENFYEKCIHSMLPMFLVADDGQLFVWTAEHPPRVRVDFTVLGLVELTDLDVFSTQEIVPAQSLATITGEYALPVLE